MQRCRPVWQQAATSTEQRISGYSRAEIKQLVVPLYRRLLRECTYIPDAHAREWIRKEAAEQFRRGQYQTAKDGEICPRRLQERMSRARRATAVLHRASTGDATALLRVLQLSYGLTGKRRRQLLAPIMPGASQHDRLEWLALNDTPKDQQQGALAAMMPAKDGQKKWNYFPKITPLLRAIGTSQIQSDLGRGSKLKTIKARLPALNSWYRPLPKIRQYNMMRDAYANFLDKLLVPIPAADRQRLVQIATGQTNLVVPRRRTPCGEHDQSNGNLLLLMTAIDSPRVRANVSKPKVEQRLSLRRVRRMVSRLLETSARVTWNAERKKWDVVWGVTADTE